jgi:uncharacterized membrane protein
VIKPPPGYSNVDGRGLNSAGEVAGILGNKYGVVGGGCFWDGRQTFVLPKLPTSSFVFARALSDTGRIVGPSGPHGAAMWTRNDDGSFAVTDLNLLLPPGFGFYLTDAQAISPDGRFIVATYADPTIFPITVVGSAILEIDPAGTLVSATALGAEFYVGGLRVDNGLLKMTGSRSSQAFLWEGPASPFNLDSGQFFDLNSPDSSTTTGGGAINSKGEVAGVGSDAVGNSRPLFWDENRQAIDMLAGQPPVSSVIVSGINDAGYVVGSLWSTNANGYVAFVWHRGAPLQTLISLKSPGDTSGVSALSYAWGINNAGQILASGVLLNPE